MEIQEVDIRPLSYEDYDSWFRGFSERESSKNEFDDGKLDMSDCDVDWFKMLVNRHQVLMGAHTLVLYLEKLSRTINYEPIWINFIVDWFFIMFQIFIS